MADTQGRIGLLGAGRMGSALASGWLRKTRGGVSADKIVLIDPRPGVGAQALIEQYGVTCAPALTGDIASTLDTLVVALKPDLVRTALSAISDDLPADALVVSIAAGVPLRTLAAALPGRPIVRAMPNTPAAIGEGVSVCVANEAADTRALIRQSEKLLKPAGLVEWISDERMMDAVTAVSGSGPAYVFLFTEALAAAAEAEGLPRALAVTLAKQTVIGAGAMMKAGLGEPDELRRNVTSPNGTTQAGLDALMSGGGLPGLVRNAVAAAERRGRQMGAQSAGD
ncbi:pyrroline-5-carboxylate reductase [Oceanicaulis sp. MMSF_3324]|uniref:pyrroline-5-carboxylate reductase n=1 Tax=Oceanicaulis sp. MMSF_3324 TaxID=3046702 RepID=UPI00273DAEBD|nr:pyrroline-5-carboxylate reductase [Oceanicaulis sp. MMSF_3324]